MSHIDCLAFGAHPDDAELFCAGTLIKLKKSGHKTAVCDLTRGELSTNGDPLTREKETENASKILGLDRRINLEIQDGNIAPTVEHRNAIIDVIRELRPQIILTPYWEDRHPDHTAAAILLKSTLFYSGLSKLKTEKDAYRPPFVLYYMSHTMFMPTVVIDISGEFAQKMQAISAYRSQFQPAETEKNKTYINSGNFLESIQARASLFGFQAGCTYGEPFYFQGPIRVNNIIEFFS